MFLQHVRALRRDDVSVHYCSPGVRAELPARIPPGNMAMLVEASCVVSGHPVVGQAAGTDTISHSVFSVPQLPPAATPTTRTSRAPQPGSTTPGAGRCTWRACSSHTGSTGRKWRRHTCSLSGNAIPPIRFQQHRGCCAYDWALPVSSSRQASSGGSATQRPHKLAGVPAAAAGAGAGGGLQAVGVDLGGEHSAVGGRHVPIVRGAAWQPVAAISDLMHCCLPQSMGQAMQVMG